MRMYRSRRMVVILAFLISLAIASAVLLFPIYFLADSKKGLAIHKENQLLQDSGIPPADIVKEVGLLNKKVNALNKKEGILVYELVSDITENKSSNINIYGIKLKEEVDQTIDLSGKAANREALLSFRRQLEQKNYVKSVDLPISNFAGEIDINFFIKIVIDNK
ncbi:MAG: hypothetical protein MRY49_03080 [Candidatus Pacebacteria bacterium]|nr:hypothetical protein [Candidatus Paceibacterota bacterium]